MRQEIDFKYGKLRVEEDESSNWKGLFETGEYQDWIIKWAERYARANSTILDVGANIGCHTIPLAQLFNMSCHVYSFEPEPRAFDTLLENVKLNNLTNVEAVQEALSDSSGEAELFVGKNSTHSTLTPQFMKKDNYLDIRFDELLKNTIDKIKTKASFNSSVLVKTSRLDELAFDNVSFIKVDIQGWECEFLEGAIETLADNKPALVLELPERTRNEKIKYLRCLKILSNISYYEEDKHNKDRLFINHSSDDTAEEIFQKSRTV